MNDELIAKAKRALHAIRLDLAQAKGQPYLLADSRFDSVEAALSADDREAALTFHDAVRIARGCTDYGGGHHTDGKMDAYQHGIQTVINALEHAERLSGLDTQLAVLHSIGGRALSPNSGEQTEEEYRG